MMLKLIKVMLEMVNHIYWTHSNHNHCGGDFDDECHICRNYRFCRLDFEAESTIDSMGNREEVK